MIGLIENNINVEEANDSSLRSALGMMYNRIPSFEANK